MNKIECPFCGSTNVKKIAYGLREFYHEDEVPGGCVIAPERPNYFCLDCEAKYKILKGGKMPKKQKVNRQPVNVDNKKIELTKEEKREKLRARWRKYYAANKDKYRAWSKAWRDKKKAQKKQAKKASKPVSVELPASPLMAHPDLKPKKAKK